MGNTVLPQWGHGVGPMPGATSASAGLKHIRVPFMVDGGIGISPMQSKKPPQASFRISGSGASSIGRGLHGQKAVPTEESDFSRFQMGNTVMLSESSIRRFPIRNKP